MRGISNLTNYQKEVEQAVLLRYHEEGNIQVEAKREERENTDSTRIGKRKCILCVDWSKDPDNYDTLFVGEERCEVTTLSNFLSI